MAKTPTTASTHSWNIPEIINGVWTKKFIIAIVPANCTKCGTKRSTTYSVNSATYGRIIRAQCTATTPCNETYEEIRLQHESHKAGKAGTKVSPGVTIPKEFFKPKFDPWVPDTRVGTGHDSTKGMCCTGRYCKGHNEFTPYAEANQPDGKSFHCRRCRGII